MDVGYLLLWRQRRAFKEELRQKCLFSKIKVIMISLNAVFSQ